MTSTSNARFISLREAANLVGRRFHAGWTNSDIDALGQTRDDDVSGWDRAIAVQALLKDYISDGHVIAYQHAEPDGSGREVIDIPSEWREAESFTICIRSGRFFVFTDFWDEILLNRASLISHLPKVTGARKAGRYHEKDVVHAAWKLALMETEVPSKAALNRLLVNWLGTGNLYPDPSTLDDITGEVIKFLSENKPGRTVIELLPPHELSP